MGGVNSQVRLTEEEIETAVRDLGDLLGPFLVRMNCFCVIQTGGNLLGRFHVFTRSRGWKITEMVFLPSSLSISPSAGFWTDERKTMKRRFLQTRFSGNEPSPHVPASEYIIGSGSSHHDSAGSRPFQSEIFPSLALADKYVQSYTFPPAVNLIGTRSFTLCVSPSRRDTVPH